MGGQNYNHRMARAAQAQADDLVLAQAALRWSAERAQPCTCSHPASDHDPDDGCLHGWGEPPAVGCMCAGMRAYQAGAGT